MNFTRIVLVIALALFVSGCAVHKAANAPSRKDTSVLRPGTPRDIVMAELGQPAASSKDDQGIYDIFKFTKGYTGGEKFLHATGHGVADVFTLGLWEVIGTPTESIAQDNEVMAKVYYDDAGKNVKNVVYLKKK